MLKNINFKSQSHPSLHYIMNHFNVIGNLLNESATKYVYAIKIQPIMKPLRYGFLVDKYRIKQNIIVIYYRACI